jgi:hypothetical protein
VIDVTYLVDSVAWSVVWLLIGYLLGLINANVRDIWKDDDR